MPAHNRLVGLLVLAAFVVAAEPAASEPAAAEAAASAPAAAEPATSETAAASWHPPVAGGVTRAFDLGPNPFEAGRHRGVDLAAAPGEPVRAPCPGEVVVAGQVGTSGRVVTIRCGRWRVTHMPLGSIAVRRGDEVGRGALLGTAAPTARSSGPTRPSSGHATASSRHAGLHLGVRREGRRFGYVDPLRFLEPARHPPPVIAGRRPPRLGPRGSPRPPATMPARSPRAPALVPRTTDPVSEPRAAGPRLHPRARPAGSSPPGLAPWPAWAGLALVLAGLGVRIGRDTATRWTGRRRSRSGAVPRVTRSS